MPTAVIVDAVRTPLGRRNGKLKDVHPVDLAAHTLQRSRRAHRPRPGARRGRDHGLRHAGRRPGRQRRAATPRSPPASPRSTVGTTIDRQCGSSQQAAHFAAQGVIAGAYDVVIAAGVENMSRVPMGASFTPGSHAVRSRDARALPGASCRRASRPSSSPRSGTSRREDNDRFSVESHLPRRAATDEGRFEREIVAGRRSTAEDGTVLMTRDEGIRPDSSLETLAQAEAGVQARRRGHRRQLVADHRRRRRGARDERGEGEPSSASRRGPASTRSPSPASTR